MWDGAESSGAAARVRRFETAWKASSPRHRPDPRTYLPDEPADRSAVLLAVLRAEVGLRWDAGDRVTVEQYRDSYPELDVDGLVALIYEEFCLREEAGEAPVPAEYDQRFPALANRLRRVFDIHDLIGSGGSAAFRVASTSEVPFPESGQTTAGFHLLEELGRGAFARVFLAEERQLADRPVALKVSRTGSREPQTLARLQHTHIVPVHSSRTDPATGLHLLCMPFFGRITLERLLADESVKKARTGADVLAALDRLEPSSGRDSLTARSVFADLPFARAIAWWWARMAEALAHAHERGVLHRDIKPSNVLITADGLPMLLDFNLARDPTTEVSGASMGGTLAYMAPEHLEALAEGNDERVDQRADLFSVGVLLFETLTGRRPYPIPTGATSVSDALHRAAETRHQPAPFIRDTHPEVPSALEAVVLKCLEADVTRRYADAAALATDLQAVADDGPLMQAREPFVSRTIRWSRRRRWPIALAGLLGLAGIFLANAVGRAREDQRRTVALLTRWIDEGESLVRTGRRLEASSTFARAAQLASSTPDFASQPVLVERRDRALADLREVNLAIEANRRAETFLATADGIRLRFGSSRNDPALARTIDEAIASSPIPAESDSKKLGSHRGDSLTSAIDELLFLRALLVAKQEEDPRQAEKIAVIGEALGPDKAPWLALRAWLANPSALVEPPSSSEAATARSCFLFGRLAEAQGRPLIAVLWFKRAARIEPELPSLRDAITRVTAASSP